MAEAERVRNEIICKKQITTESPDTHSELIMKIEGLSEKETEELRSRFHELFEAIQMAVRKETDVVMEETEAEEPPRSKKSMRMKDGKPYFV